MKKLGKSMLLFLFIWTSAAGVAGAGSGPELLKDIEVHGFVSSAYTLNFNDPSTGMNANRIFDTDDDAFKLDVAELVLLKETPNPGDIGFRTDVTYGFSLPEVTKSSPGPSVPIASPAGPAPTDVSDDDFDLQQAYVSYNAPIGKGIQVDFGKFITHVGAEVIEGYDGWNYNYSRSFLFGLAIPFTHTGMRASYALSDTIGIMGMIANGWDNTSDNNDSKTLGAQVAITPTDNISILLNWAGGVENPDRGDWRHVFDTVIDLGVTDKTLVQLNATYGYEDNASAVVFLDDAVWWGFAGIVRHDYNKWFSINARGEVFRDEDGARTSAGMDQRLWEFTLTPEFRVNQNLVVRFEYRHDESNKTTFSGAGNAGSLRSIQNTVAMNALFYF